MSFITQPDDLIIEQLSHLAIPDLFRVERVNKRLRDILTQKTFWIKKIIDFGDLPDRPVDYNHDPRDYYLNILHYPGYIYYHTHNDYPVVLREHSYIPRRDLIEHIKNLLASAPKEGFLETILFNIDVRPTTFTENMLFECSGYAVRDHLNHLRTSNLTQYDANYVTQIDIILHMKHVSYISLTEMVSQNHYQYKTAYYKQFMPYIISENNKRMAATIANPKIFKQNDQKNLTLQKRKQVLIKWIIEQLRKEVPWDLRSDSQIQKNYGFQNYKQMQQFQRDYIKALTEQQIVTMEILYQSIKSRMLSMDDKIVIGLIIDINEKIMLLTVE